MSWKLTQLSVENFRNLEKSALEFSPHINCIFGDNGNGKTNLLEAIHWVCHRKSFKTNASFSQLLSYDHEKPYIRFFSRFHNKEDAFNYNGEWQTKNKTYYFDGVKTNKKPPIDAIFINPFDSFLFHQQKSFRRNWIDSHLGLVDPLYKKTLQNYEKSRRQRKKILEKDLSSPVLDQFERLIVQDSLYISKKRISFLEKINPILTKSFFQFFSETHELKIELDSTWKNFDETDRLADLKSRRQKDSIIGQTTAGIHKDDFIFYFDQMNSFEFCSLGQQKMSYLSLIFSFIEFYIGSMDQLPLVLIDDVSGELDTTRWKNLISFLIEKKFQVFITTANEGFKNLLEKENVKEFYVKDGLIE